MLTADIVHGFSGSILAKKYDAATPTPRFHIELWELFCSNNKCAAVAAPRGHGKSTAVTFAYALANMLFREKRFMIIVSDTEAQAINFLSDIKSEIKDNEDLINLFNVKGFIKDSETSIIVEFDDGATFRVDAKGQGFKRGMKWDNKRPDLIICDDLENEEVVYNKDRRDKFKRWFYGTVIPSLSKDGILRVVGTILHLDSLLNNLMPIESLRSTTIEPLRTYNFVTRDQWKSVRYRAHTEDFSQILWPTRWSKEELQKLKEDYEIKGLSDVYSQEYLNYPIDESTSFFKRHELLEIPQKQIESLEEDKEDYTYYVGVDFAISTAQRSDYTALAIVALDKKGVLYVPEIRRGRWDALEIVEQLFAIQSQYEPEMFFIERGAIEKAIGSVLNHEMLSRRKYLNIQTNTPTKDKQTRARSLQKLVRAGAIKFDKTSHWYADFEDELVRFPKARHDDQVDALSWVGLCIDKMEMDIADPEADEMEEEFNYMNMSKTDGRSLVCGY